MTSELMSLSWVLALQLVMWVPYILNMIAVRGLMDAVSYPDDPKPMAARHSLVPLQRSRLRIVEGVAPQASRIPT